MFSTLHSKYILMSIRASAGEIWSNDSNNCSPQPASNPSREESHDALYSNPPHKGRLFQDHPVPDPNASTHPELQNKPPCTLSHPYPNLACPWDLSVLLPQLCRNLHVSQKSESPDSDLGDVGKLGDFALLRNSQGVQLAMTSQDLELSPSVWWPIVTGGYWALEMWLVWMDMCYNCKTHTEFQRLRMEKRM